MSAAGEGAAEAAAVQEQSPRSGRGGLLINVDNGGTLTDLCVIDGDRVYRTKTITTPYDLAKCLFEGLRKASRAIYGKEDLQALLLATEYIRYSTTQGTNALVERKGPRLGVILGGSLSAAGLQADAQQQSLYAALVGERAQVLDAGLAEEALETAAVRAVNALASAGANRIVVAFGGAGRDSAETRLKRVLLRKFPPHLLGAIPILYSHEVVEDADDGRRAWTALFNAFLHPAMERFLYNAEHKLREYRTRNPLLIFRNDGQSARVAKTIAIKTYSSGPRGGAEGARALAAHYGFRRLLSMDVGGTTTDITLVEDGVVHTERRGRVEGVATSFPLCAVVSVGVGGSSIIKVQDGTIRVGPESVGGAPGPACFGLGGREATSTDAFLVLGLLDPASYFGGELKIDAERARAAIEENIARPLGIGVELAAQRMEQAWTAKIADSLRQYTAITPDTTLAAFGGAGPFVVCKVAEAAGISRVVIPGLAAVFSAFGIGFSDIGHQYEAPLASNDEAGLADCRRVLTERARRGMFAEGADLEQCLVQLTLRIARDGGEESVSLAAGGGLPPGLPGGAHLSLALNAVKPIAHTSLSGRFGQTQVAAQAAGTRRTMVDGQWREVPLYRAEEQAGGAAAQGPAVLEEAFFTCRVERGWRLEINQAGDILLTRC
ncbi:MAG: hydantoinase/oxoprolinase family protein [Nevskia sp.]|nr:hydantoinase/oxoprolinase family protein [Nevskia sp.]